MVEAIPFVCVAVAGLVFCLWCERMQKRNDAAWDAQEWTPPLRKRTRQEKMQYRCDNIFTENWEA